MKKLLLVTLLFSSLCYSQFSFGPKVGVTYLSIKKNSLIPYPKSQPSYFIGGFGEYKFSKFAIALETEYASLKINNEFEGLKEEYQFNTLNIYLMPKYYILPTFTIGVGPYISNSISAKLKKDNHGPEKDMSDFFKKTSVGIAIAAEYKIYKELLIEVKYSIGLTNEFKISESEYISSGDFDPIIDGSIISETQKRFLSIGLGYKF